MQDVLKVKALLFMKGHSERIPRKNLKPLCEKPLLHWILETLSKSRYIQEIVLNTDDSMIAQEARDNFNVTIHWRPEYLLKISSNEASQIMAYDLTQTDGEFFLQTHSTNPLLKTETIDRAIEVYFENITQYDSLFSVTPLQKRFYWSDGNPINHDPDHMIKTQELPFIYEENSCIYIFSRQVFEKCGGRIGQSPYMFEMDPFESVDIDEPIDFYIADALMNNRLSR